MRQDRRTTLSEVAVIVGLLVISSAAYFQGVTFGATAAPDVIAPTVSASINTASPGTESFWSQLTPLTIPLTATDDYGGATPSVAIKVATNGTHLLFSSTWSDPSQSIKRVSGGPSAGSSYPGLFFANGTIHGFDQFAVWWSLSQNPGPPPCMQLGQPGKGGPASLAGQGNLWRWTASSTDSGGASFATAKYGKGTPLAGHLINYTHSFARDLLLNTTGFFTLGYDSSNVNSTVAYDSSHVAYNDQVVWAKGIYDSTAHTWTLIAARPLTTTPSQSIAQFAQGQVFHFALGAWDGGAHPIPAGVPAPAGWTQMSDDGETKSISSWYTMSLSSAGPVTTTSSTSSTSTSSGSGGVADQSQGFLLVAALVASIATLAVGFGAGFWIGLRRAPTGEKA